MTENSSVAQLSPSLFFYFVTIYDRKRYTCINMSKPKLHSISYAEECKSQSTMKQRSNRNLIGIIEIVVFAITSYAF